MQKIISDNFTGMLNMQGRQKNVILFSILIEILLQ